MSHCCGLSSSESCELGRIRKSTCRGIRGERCSPGLAHTCLASDPGATNVDGVARSAVARLVLFKQVQDVLGAHNGPFRYQPVVFVSQRPATTDGDQSGVTLFRENRHDHIMAVLSGGVVHANTIFAVGNAADAVTDAGTALQMLLDHLGYAGRQLGDQLKAARKAGMVSPSPNQVSTGSPR
jgi:hypothetical protein